MWPIDDDTAEPDAPEACWNCGEEGPCAPLCVRELDAADDADRAYDERSADPWDGIF